jgi:hypothetical protein
MEQQLYDDDFGKESNEVKKVTNWLRLVSLRLDEGLSLDSEDEERYCSFHTITKLQSEEDVTHSKKPLSPPNPKRRSLLNLFEKKPKNPASPPNPSREPHSEIEGDEEVKLDEIVAK